MFIPAWVHRINLQWKMHHGRGKLRVREIVKQVKSVLPLPKDDALKGTVGLSPTDAAVVEHIRQLTASANRNNLTRTEAYLHAYEAHPEIHWALLAHVVSRNGGFSMTDLQGEWFERISDGTTANRYFSLLERANWLIFQDAYPQLLLYKESCTQARDLTHLLPVFGVSRFMTAMWKDFRSTKDSASLTRALILNEQNYIEGRLIASSPYRETVIETSVFELQSLLNLNHVLLPYLTEQGVRLGGTTVKSFKSLSERIRTGIRLYTLLFGQPHLHQQILRFLVDVPHTASRSDYWPEVFSAHMPDRRIFESRYTPRLSAEDKSYARSNRSERPSVPELPQEVKIASPPLCEAWKDVKHPPAANGDWFHDVSQMWLLFWSPRKLMLDYTDTYLQKLREIEHLVQIRDAAFRSKVPYSHQTLR